MIDPVIFSFTLFGGHITLTWYGVILVTAMIVGALLADKEFQRRGGDDEFVWNIAPIVLIAAIFGARLWYVLNATLGGSKYYTTNPLKTFAIWEGGLHIFGGLLLGGYVAYLYAKRNKVDFLMILDSLAPSLLIGQALARPANFVNQELYGPPTEAAWGIPIAEVNRMSPWNNMAEFPAETRFHPTFAYEMIWNLITGGILLWLVRKYPEKMKPGAAFALWLVFAGIGRFIIEIWRPDQPRIVGLDLSYSRVVAAIMALVGACWLMVRFEKWHFTFWRPGPKEYRIKKKPVRKFDRSKRA